MATDKKISYVIQGGGPNYLGKQKMVTAPKKWKSSPTHPEAHLAYITDKEQDLLIKKDLYGSLKGKPNKGPSGIVSLQGDLGGWSSGGGKGGNTGGDRDKGKGGSSREDYKQSNYYKMMTGTGTTATSAGGDTYRSKNIAKGAVPEYVNTPDGLKYVGAKNKWVGKSLFNRDGYRSTHGTSPTLLDRVFRRNNPMGSIKTRKNPVTGQLEYYSEDENVGQAKPGWGGRILGGLSSLLTGIPLVGGFIGNQIDKYKPKSYWDKMDPSEQRRLNALNITPYNERKISLQNDMPMESLVMDQWGKTPINNDIVPQKKPNNFISNLNDPSNMASGMQISNDQISSMNNLINQNNTTPFRPTDAMTGNYNTGAIPNRNRTNFNQFTGEWYADGGRTGYRNGEFVDENINVEGPNFDVNENIEMAEGPSPFEMRIEELMDEGMSWQEAYNIASQEFSSVEGPEDSFSQEGIASIV